MNTTDASVDEVASLCEQEWKRLLEQYGNAAPILLIAEWMNLSEKYGGTGIYEFRLANLFERMGRIDDARKIVEQGLQTKTKFEHFLRLSKHSYEYSSLALGGVKDPEKYVPIVDGLLQLSADYPEWAPAWEHLALVQTQAEMFDAALASAEKAIALEPNSWMGLRTKVIVLAKKNLCIEAQPLIAKAIELDALLLGDADFMYSAAQIHIGIGHHKIATELLRVLAERNPAVKKDREFIELVERAGQTPGAEQPSA